MSSTESLVAGVQTTDNNRERMKFYPKSMYCDENHWRDQCARYAAVKAGKQRIKGTARLLSV